MFIYVVNVSHIAYISHILRTLHIYLIMPTLIEKGRLVPNHPNAPKLDDYVPIKYIIDWIRERQTKTGKFNRILALRSDTGSGKSTTFPVAVFDAFNQDDGRLVGITQPKIMTAIAIPQDQIQGMPWCPHMRVGYNLGWQTGPAKMRLEAPGGIMFMTVGSLSMQLRTQTPEKLFQKYRFIIIDEAHEMSLELGVVIYMLRELVNQYGDKPEFPFLIFTSGTFVPEKFLRYFGISDPEHFEPNLIQVSGFTYAKHKHFLDHPCENYLDETVRMVKYIHEDVGKDDPAEKADIMIFLPGATEFRKVAQELEKLNRKCANDRKFLVLQIESKSVSGEKYDFVVSNVLANKLKVTIDGRQYTPMRKIILTTSVAETGVTIDWLKYVIDSGYHRGTEFNPHVGVSMLITAPAPQSRIRQRMGRSGRKFDGEFYPLYTEETYNKLQMDQYSDLIIADFSKIALNVIPDITINHDVAPDAPNRITSTEEYLVDRIDLLDNPPIDSVHLAMEKLYTLGLIEITQRTPLDDKSGSETTYYRKSELGQIARAMMSTDIEHLRMIMAGFAFDVSIFDLITIAAWMLVDKRSMEPPDDKDKKSEKKPGKDKKSSIKYKYNKYYKFDKKFDQGATPYRGNKPRYVQNTAANATAANATAANATNDTVNTIINDSTDDTTDDSTDDTINTNVNITGSCENDVVDQMLAWGGDDNARPPTQLMFGGSEETELAVMTGGFEKKEILWEEVYKQSLPDFLGKKSSHLCLKTRILIADHFIDGLFLHRAAINVMRDGDPSEMTLRLQRWCKKCNINYGRTLETSNEGLIGFLKIRENIIEELLTAGVNVFYLSQSGGIWNQLDEDFMTYIVKLKHCIYDGFRENLAIYDETHGIYRIKGAIVQQPDLIPPEDIKRAVREGLIDAAMRPKRILYSGLASSFDKKSLLYTVALTQISVMDGFVEIN